MVVLAFVALMRYSLDLTRSFLILSSMNSLTSLMS